MLKRSRNGQNLKIFHLARLFERMIQALCVCQTTQTQSTLFEFCLQNSFLSRWTTSPPQWKGC